MSTFLRLRSWTAVGHKGGKEFFPSWRSTSTTQRKRGTVKTIEKSWLWITWQIWIVIMGTSTTIKNKKDSLIQHITSSLWINSMSVIFWFHCCFLYAQDHKTTNNSYRESSPCLYKSNSNSSKKFNGSVKVFCRKSPKKRS